MKHTSTTARAYEDIPRGFPRSGARSWKLTYAHVAALSGIKPVLYDCCIDSCVCFTGPHSDLEACPYCHKGRYDEHGQPQNRFSHIPLIPRLKAYLANTTMANKMQHRATGHVHSPDMITDVYDGHHYRSLLGKHVVIDGKERSHKFFEDPRDIALGLSTDGFAPFQHKSGTAWPLILYNYNLPPEIRFLREYIMCLGIIPGPNKPHDPDSFLWPVVEELLKLEMGVTAWDAEKDEYFKLRAFLILVFGDIPAMSMIMRMKGHNGICPCRWCSIKGVRIPGRTHSPYYVPLDRSTHPDVLADPTKIGTYSGSQLPMRTHEEFMEQAQAVQFAETAAAGERLAKETGVKGVPILSYLSSISFPQSFPYDFMHLIWENVLKNLFSFWTGKYKDLDEGNEVYQIDDDDWKEVGCDSASSKRTIPSCFGPPPFDVAADKTRWTADLRSFWNLYIGPVLLNGKLPPKFYDHYMDLVKLLHICMQFEMTRDDIQTLRNGFVKWVEDYEMCVQLSLLLDVLLILKFDQGYITRMILNAYLHARSLSMLSFTSQTALRLLALSGDTGLSPQSAFVDTCKGLSRVAGFLIPTWTSLCSTRLG